MGDIIKLNDKNHVDFRNNVDFCVGTGRLGLGLTDEYIKELKLCQEEIGFSYIRGHGLFCDDIAIYHQYEEDGEVKVEYNYAYLDRIFDKYLELNIRPYLELGFMPYEMASGTQTVFYWKGNTTPPKDYKLWTDMVVALLKHLRARYGEEVLTWPIEVWNEPNLPGFWEHADMQEYFKLFKETFLAIKAYDSRFKVGGPAICGVREEEWMREFLKFCRENKLAVDTITRHHYTIEFPDKAGHYDYSKLMDDEAGFMNLKATRNLVNEFDEYKECPIHITEFNTSYTPKGVIHDTNLNAAFLARQLSRLGDDNELYSYWTFGDVFEEQGVPFTPFHGGFGLVAAGCIPKPTFWTFAFFKQLKNKAVDCIHRDADSVVVKTCNGYAGIAWNIDKEPFKLTFNAPANASEYTLITKTVDEECCNPLKIWHDLGEPSNPSKAETELIKSGANPLVKTEIVKADAGNADITINLNKNAVVYFELIERKFTPDRGYDYERVLSFH